MPVRVAQKEELISAGLGEKKIMIPDVSCSCKEFQNTLINEFPKLEDAGGFELLRCIPNSKTLEKMSPSVSTSPKMLKGVIGSGRIYIRPLQRDLCLSELDTANTPEVILCI